MRLGRDCIACCAGFTTLLLVTGLMDLVAMALVTIAISAERLTGSVHVARGIGVAMWVWGACLLVRVAG